MALHPQGRQSDGVWGAQKISIKITWSGCVSWFTLSCRGTETRRQGVRLSLRSKVLVHRRMKQLSGLSRLDVTGPRDTPGMALCQAMRQVFLLVVVSD